jgi:predicted nucleotidyltransferase
MEINSTDLLSITRSILASKTALIGGEHKFLHISQYGSRVYGTTTEFSDYDVLVIIDSDEVYELDLHNNEIDFNGSLIKVDISILSKKTFLSSIEKCDVRSVEILSVPEQFILLETDFMEECRKNFDPSQSNVKSAIRTSFSAKSDWAQARTVKKLIDKEYRIAIKSLWHSYRVIKFAIQLAKYGRIIDFTESNDFWDILKIIKEEDMTDVMLKNLYKEWVKTPKNGSNNSLLTEFKNLLPK